MSVCLAVTKTIAVSSLGVYCGMLGSAYAVACVTPLDILSSALSKPAKVVVRIGSALAVVSSAFFGLSYFGAPSYWRHPYLLYGMLVAPASAAYAAGAIALRRAQLERRSRGKGKSEAPSSPPQPSLAAENAALDSSVVDLGAPTEHAPETVTCPCTSVTPDEESSSSSSSCCVSRLHLPVLLTLASAGLVQSVLGLYGEGLFV